MAPEPIRFVRRMAAALALWLAVAGPASSAEPARSTDVPDFVDTGETVESGASAHKARKKRLSQNRYYTMKPFSLPLIQQGEVVEQFTLIVAMEIATEGGRPALAQRVPRIRDEMYQVLLRMVTFRRHGAPIPDVDAFKIQLRKVAVNVAGEELVKDILVQQAYKRPVR